jgi:hypothetical protein
VAGSGLDRLLHVCAKELSSDLVIDAAGRCTPVDRWLEDIGAAPAATWSADCGVAYYSRHYRICPGRPLPVPPTTRIVAGLEEFTLAVFSADNGAVQLAIVPLAADRRFRRVKEPDVFTAVLRTIPASAAWLEVLEPISPVFPMTGPRNTLRRLALLAITYVCLPETLAPASRRSDSTRAALRTMRAVITDRAFLVNALGCGIGFGAIFSYVAGAPFALENSFGLSPAQFSLAFGLNGAGLILASHVNGRLVGRLGPMRLFTYGAFGLAAGSVGLLFFLSTHALGLFAVMACMFLVLSSNGFIAPNAMALALNDFPYAAGSASALLGVLQFSIGAAAAPVVGVAGPHNDLPMGISMAFFGVSALAVRTLLSRRRPLAPATLAAGPAPCGCAAEAAPP